MTTTVQPSQNEVKMEMHKWEILGKTPIYKQLQSFGLIPNNKGVKAIFVTPQGEHFAPGFEVSHKNGLISVSVDIIGLSNTLSVIDNVIVDSIMKQMTDGISSLELAFEVTYLRLVKEELRNQAIEELFEFYGGTKTRKLVDAILEASGDFRI